MDYLQMGFQLMGYGLSGVFIMLALFIITIKLLTKLLPDRKDKGS